ncbi:Rieske (2Fe-2S) protein [bacterium]|nr:Rieske (2Fe-2S) protein [bacterium]MCI0603759.1 Rieske (2Fe-2S) protein [bacterium]
MWIQTVPAEELERKGRVVFRNGARQFALMKLNGRVFALDNRCPHEGYPLSEGTVNVQDCVLTCNWHNWKFSLNNGENISGEDNVNVYETRQESGKVWIHVPEIPEEVLLDRSIRQLKKAFENQSYDRMVRELVRMHFHKLDPLHAVRKGMEWSWQKLEYGMDHAYAVTADWLVFYREFTEIDKRLICLSESLDYLAETSLRQPEFPYTTNRMDFTEEAFLQAIEREDEDAAIAMVNGALAAGLHFSELEEFFTDAALMHYQDFGHSLIYVSKISRLIDSLGVDMERFLLPSLVRSICSATREDLIPEFRKLSQMVGAGLVPALAGDHKGRPYDDLFGKSVDYCLSWVVEKSSHSSPEKMYDALLQTNAKNLLHFDMSFQFNYENNVSTNIGWLDFTHGLTFANAVRLQCTKFPRLWKQGLLQMACFSGRNHKYLDPNIAEEDWMVQDREEFFRQCIEQILDHGKSTPIYAAHYVKTFLAVRTEVNFASETCAKYMLAGLNRYFHSPLKEKHVRRTVLQALDLVGLDFRI